MHSEHFRNFDPSKGKTKASVEAEHGLVGLINHMKELGYSRYQWSIEEQLITQEGRDEIIAEYGSLDGLTHFVEYFGEYHQGYIRSDSQVSIRDAFEKAVNKVQKHLACEHSTGHDFVPFTANVEYTKGLVECKHCGFNGYTNLIKRFNSEIEHFKFLANKLNKDRSNFIRAAEKAGVKFNLFGNVIADKRDDGEAIIKRANEIKESIDGIESSMFDSVFQKIANRLAAENIKFKSLKLADHPSVDLFMFTGIDLLGKEFAFDVEYDSKTNTILLAVTLNSNVCYYDTFAEMKNGPWHFHDILNLS